VPIHFTGLLKYAQQILKNTNWYLLCIYTLKGENYMKTIFYTLSILLVFASCKSSKDYLSRGDEDRTFFDVVKAINKKQSNADAANALPVVYQNVSNKHLKKISNYATSNDIAYLDKTIEEYAVLQKMYQAINNSSACSNLITATNFEKELYATKLQAAEAYYNLGNDFLNRAGRDNAKKAYQYFKKSDRYINGYKNATTKMAEAYEQSILLVLINPIQDQSFTFNTGWGNNNYNYNNEYFQQSLIRELGGKYSTTYAARFFSDWEINRENIQPDWVVDIVLRNLDISKPDNYSSNRQVSNSVEDGRDSSGHIKYKTVYATMHINTKSFSANAEMEVNIRDIATRRNIDFSRCRESYSWTQETANYSGDSRALSNSDWELINNFRNSNEPQKQEVVNELYKKLFPQVKNKISFAVQW
jgi:hypothetical protein